MVRPMTFFVDVDGCVLEHVGPAGEQWEWYQKALPGVVEVLNALEKAGHRIVLTTARPHRVRRMLEENLAREKIAYHQLVTDLVGGTRWLVNDAKEPDKVSCVVRNTGLRSLLDEVRDHQ